MAAKHVGSPGRYRTTVEASRWWKALAATCGGVAPLARRVGLPQQTIVRFIEREGVRFGNADEGDRIMRLKGFEGVSGLERTEPLPTPSPSPSEPPSGAPAAA